MTPILMYAIDNLPARMVRLNFTHSAYFAAKSPTGLFVISTREGGLTHGEIQAEDKAVNDFLEVHKEANEGRHYQEYAALRITRPHGGLLAPWAIYWLLIHWLPGASVAQGWVKLTLADHYTEEPAQLLPLPGYDAWAVAQAEFAQAEATFTDECPAHRAYEALARLRLSEWARGMMVKMLTMEV